MAEKLYCEGAASADIYLELPNGKERLIRSLSPPVKITTGLSAYRFLEFYIRYKNEDGNQQWLYEVGFESMLYEGEDFKDDVTVNEGTHSGEDEIVWEVVREFKGVYDSENPPDESRFGVYKRKILPLDYSQGFSHSVHQSLYWLGIYPRQINIENCYIIEDKEKVLYAAEETGKEAVRVDCFNCPDGLCPIRSRESIECLDCERVKNSLDEMNRAVLRLLN